MPPTSELVVAGVPSNVILPPGARVAEVQGDVYGICERLRQYDPNIRVVPVEDAGDGFTFLICELGPDGVLRDIMPVRELDGRVVERLQYLASVPAAQRLAEIQKQLDADKLEREANDAAALYEKLGGPIYSAMFSAGFARTPNPQSVRPLNATAKRAGRHA